MAESFFYLMAQEHDSCFQLCELGRGNTGVVSVISMCLKNGVFVKMKRLP